MKARPTIEDDWLRRFAQLRVDSDTVKGRAPHKPLLLLAVLDLIEAGQLRDEWLPLSADLVTRFQNYWPIVEPRRKNKGDIRMPFHALGSQVWEVFDADGRPSMARALTRLVRLPSDLMALLTSPAFRERLRLLLVRTYFTLDEQVALFAALGREDEAPAAAEEDGIRWVEARETGRSARFKTQIVTGYRFTCALTGYRLTTVDQAGIVEAAHIHALRSSQNNDPDNGLALTPTAHALFDMGLWSIGNDLRVLVKPESQFIEDGPPGGFSLRALIGRPLHFDHQTRLRPGAIHVSWHRRTHGFEG